MAEEIAAVAATKNYISNEAKAKTSRRKNIIRTSRLMSETAMDETSSKDSMLKYTKVKDVRATSPRPSPS